MTTFASDEYSVYCYYMGNGNYQMFINNVSADADFIRIITGYTEMRQGKRRGRITKQWIISPLRPDTEHVYIDTVTRYDIAKCRVWIAFEAVRRDRYKNQRIKTYLVLSPTPSKWRKTIGSLTSFEIRVVDSLKTVGELQN